MSQSTDSNHIAPWSLQSYGFWSNMKELASSSGDASHRANDSRMHRRSALGVLAASAALAGLPGCRRPDIELRPYSKTPEDIIPGMSLFYSSAVTRGGDALPILVETHEGRPTKIEGHPDFGPTGGASDAITQAAILELYDPDRLSMVRRGNVTSSWRDFDAFADSHFRQIIDAKGEGFRILSDATPSPALRLLQQHLADAAPLAKWHTYEPLNYGNEGEALIAVTGVPLRPQFDFANPDIIVSLDADFLSPVQTQAVASARAFSSRRSPEAMNRLYVFEPTLTLTGGMADHRFDVAASDMAMIAVAIARELGLFNDSSEWSRQSSELLKAVDTVPNPSVDREVIQAIATDLNSHRGRGLVVAGERQPSLVHAIVFAMNVALQNSPNNVRYLESANPTPKHSLQELAADVEDSVVDTLLVVGGNPIYNAPASMELAKKFAQIRHTIRLGLYEDETAKVCKWRLPAAHAFESWSDAETADGYYLPMQPMIAPLYDGRSPLSLLARLLQFETDQEYEVVRASFSARRESLQGIPTFDGWLHDGMAKDDVKEFNPSLNDQLSGVLLELLSKHSFASPSFKALEVCFQQDASVFDGSFANLGWLQEMPDPVTKLAWDNAALLNAQTASELGVETGRVVRVSLDGRSLEAPVLVQPGNAKHSISLPLGYGRTNAGHLGASVGFDAYKLRSHAEVGFSLGVKIEATEKTHRFALAQQGDRIDDRDIAREQTIDQFKKRAESIEQAGHVKGAHDDHDTAGDHVDHHASAEKGHESLPLIEPPTLDGKHQWGMTIDLNKCIGCSACMVACQSENNIPVVGREEVALGRSMHWIRVDRYYRGPEEAPEVIHEPVACMHCENAPCETVCPVNASVHSPEGLNLQVYNRCVGTRYCSNNCPYKARKFNWFDYQQRELDQLRLGPLGGFGMAETLKMQKNPDVTVRMRGVMEKCTYCVQRIERGKAGAKLASPGSPDYTLADGQIVPACAQACPSQAIVFGDLNDESSEVVKQKQDPRRFDLLNEIGTKPRTSYLARLRNPNPRVEAVLKHRAEGT